MSNDVTLKDIAAATGASLTSVYRAINEKEGIGDELRRAILDKADKMGYKTNYAASALKRKPIKMALVLPDNKGDNQHYYQYFWRAFEHYNQEIENMNVQISAYGVKNKEEQRRVLAELLKEENRPDGLLTVPLDDGIDMHLCVDRLVSSGVATVLIDNDMPDTQRLCCISPHDSLSGRLGGEFLAGMIHSAGKILVFGGDSLVASHVQNLQGFCDYMEGCGKGFEVVTLNGDYEPQALYEQATDFLASNKDVVGFYAVTARETLPLCQAVEKCGYGDRLVGLGSDLYPESAKLLSEGMVKGLLYKNPYSKAYTGLKVLGDYLIKKQQPESDKLFVPISIIMQSNLFFYSQYL